MTKITFITPDCETQIVEAHPGENLMEAAVRHDIQGIDADCGGGCACATCHVILDGDTFAKAGKVGEEEHYLIDFLDNQHAHSRLSCQIEVDETLEGMVVRIPAL